jgi:hypothetical protein
MNAPTLNDLRNGLPVRDFSDDKMTQIRDLLVGDFTRATDARMLAMESRIRDLETGLGQRLTTLHQRIESLAEDHSVDRKAAFDELAKSVLDLGDRIRMITR